jgi:putative aminopeptidase FrvX
LNIDLLHRLTAVHGIAGFEHEVRAVVDSEIRPLVDDVRTDRLGNLIATKHGTGGPIVLVAAHMDEIGFLVRHVDARGFLRLQPLGSFDPRVLLAQRVLVHPSGGDPIPGIIETTVDSLHFRLPQEPRLEMKDLFVDVGPAASRAEIGDMVTLDRGLAVSGDRIVSRALDDRLGLLVMIEALRQVREQGATIVAVATTQEEVGSRGAMTAGFDIDPDICIALDLTIANDIPGAEPDQEVTRLGDGPAIKVMDTSQVSHPGIVRHLRDLAGEHGIPYQLEVLNHGGTDASLVQRLRAGVAVATISIPARYIHTVNETASISDADLATTLLARYLEDVHTRALGAPSGSTTFSGPPF